MHERNLDHGQPAKRNSRLCAPVLLNGDADEAAQVLKGTSSLLNMLASSDGLNHKNAGDCLTVLAGIIDAATVEMMKGQNA